MQRNESGKCFLGDGMRLRLERGFGRKLTFYLNSPDNCFLFSTSLRKWKPGETCLGNSEWLVSGSAAALHEIEACKVFRTFSSVAMNGWYCVIVTFLSEDIFWDQSLWNVILPKQRADKSFVDSETPDWLLCTRLRTGSGRVEKNVRLVPMSLWANEQWKMSAGPACWLLARPVFLGPGHMIPQYL